MNMEDIKIITVILGNGGKIAAKFNKENGELRLYPNEQADNAPGAKLYELASECSQWSMADTPKELQDIKKDE